MFQITRTSDRHRLLSVREADNTKQALVDYYNETLVKSGFHRPVYRLNALYVLNKREERVAYSTKEV